MACVLTSLPKTREQLLLQALIAADQLVRAIGALESNAKTITQYEMDAQLAVRMAAEVWQRELDEMNEGTEE